MVKLTKIFNIDEVVRRSVKNCHAKGVDSLLLWADGDKELRVFIAPRGQHTLESNNLAGFRYTLPMSVGLHNHRFKVTLVPLDGCVYNIMAARPHTLDKLVDVTSGLYEDRTPPQCYYLGGWRWDPALLGGTGRFVRTERLTSAVYVDRPRQLRTALRLPSDLLHTVCVDQYASAAWAVVSNGENKHHSKVCYTNDDLSLWSSSGYYIPMSRADVEHALTVTLGRCAFRLKELYLNLKYGR